MTLILAPRPRLLTAAVLFCFGLRLSAAPTVTQQPTDVTVTSGQNATFTVAATGSGPLAFQWRRSGFAIPGATAATFVWSGTTLGEAGFYDVLVSDTNGSTRSNVVQLTVQPRAYPSAVATDPTYTLPLDSHTGARIAAFAPSADGGYYITGSFVTVGDVRRTFIVHVTSAGAVDPAFVPPEITGMWGNALAVQPDGKVVLGGYFSHAGNARHRSLLRLNPDGSLDTSFTPLSYYAGDVTAVAIQPDGKIIAPGSQGVTSLTRFNPDGSVDTTIAGNMSGGVSAIVFQPDGKLLVAGMITATANGQTFQSVVRLNADGTIDPSFQTPAYNGYPSALAVASDGSIYLAGNPNSGSGQAALVRLSATGSVDPSFAPQFDASVNAIALQPDGKIVVGGHFTSVNQIHHPFLARLNANGSLDLFGSPAPAGTVGALLLRPDGSVIAGFDSVIGNATTAPVQYFANGGIGSMPALLMRAPATLGGLVRLPGGKFAVIGAISHAGALQTNTVVHLNADASLDATFASASTDPAPTSVAQAMALPDGRIALAGAFYNLAGRGNAGVAIVKADGSVDYSFNQSWVIPLFGNAVALTPEGRIVLGGNIQNATTVTSAVMEYNLDGSPVPGFTVAPQFNGNVWTIAAQRDGKILAGGYFSRFNATAVSSLVRLNADGTLDTGFSANAHVTSIGTVQVAPSGQIYYNGTWSGPDGTYVGIVRLNADGTRDASFHPSIIGSSVYAIMVEPDGSVLAWIVPAGTAAPYLGRFNTDGTADPGFRAFTVDPGTAARGMLMLLRDDGQLVYTEGDQNGDRVRTTVTPTLPVLTATPSATVVPVGGSTILRIVAGSIIPLTYQWQYNGAPIAGATNASYTIANFSAATAGNYNVVVSNQLGSATTGPVAVTAPLDSSGHLVNLSIRATAGDMNPLVLGVVLGGAGTGGDTPLLFRGAGPTLTYFNVPGALADPVLELYDGTGFKIDQNDDWTGVFDFTSVGAFPFRGTAPKDAAIYNPYATNGAQTIHILGKPGASGAVLGEVYDATPGGAFTVTTPRIINGSARTAVGTGDNALILGFGVAGQGSVRVLIRAIGPTLAGAPFNLGGMLADPTLEIRAGDNSVVATNDNWSDNGAAATMTAAFDSVGAFHLGAGSKDSAAIVTLAPGTYSAVIRGANATTGTAMVELYVLP